MKEANNINHLAAHEMATYIDALKVDKLHKVPPAILRHIDQCDFCHREALDLYSILGEQDYSQLGVHSVLDEPVKTFNMRRLFVRVAAAAAILILAFFYYQQTQNKPKDGDIVTEELKEELAPEQEKPANIPLEELKEKPTENIVDQAPKAVKPKLIPAPKLSEPQDDRIIYAANFTPSEQWESMVNETVRGESFKAKAPLTTAVFQPGATIRFEWASDSEETLQLVLLNNKGEELVTVALSGNELLWNDKLVPGRYYWKVESEDDLLHVGRFEVAGH